MAARTLLGLLRHAFRLRYFLRQDLGLRLKHLGNLGFWRGLPHALLRQCCLTGAVPEKGQHCNIPNGVPWCRQNSNPKQHPLRCVCVGKNMLWPPITEHDFASLDLGKSAPDRTNTSFSRIGARWPSKCAEVLGQHISSVDTGKSFLVGQGASRVNFVHRLVGLCLSLS